MKHWFIFALVSLSLPVAAQPPGMTEQDMQRMMENAQKMQECMQGIDQAAIEPIEAKSREFEQKVKALCLAGKRDEAQKLAIQFGREMAANETVKKIQQCSKIMQGMMPRMNVPSPQELKEHHICDNY
ncbi:MAG: hypothetical protein AXA67_10885 [Methylothermaceae bacteria B42]|nr:MAG: hypothetical protein AXA67_10885 [Methylothermaceae bacteria B42]HHJ38980.1 hypothetical protein [Methylothermaceae bacterium]